MKKQVINLDNPILVTPKEQLEEMTQQAFKDLMENSATKAEITLKLTVEVQEKDGVMHPSIKHKINYNNTDSVKSENSEVKEETIHKSHIKGEAIHKALELVLYEDKVCTQEVKTPLEKIADEKKDNPKGN